MAALRRGEEEIRFTITSSSSSSSSSSAAEPVVDLTGEEPARPAASKKGKK